MAATSIRAFSDSKYDYYRLTKDFGRLKAGAIFYHDTDDTIYGSAAYGCLKNCWTPDGNCYNGLCGGTVILHYSFVESDCFQKVECTVDTITDALSCGYYTMEVHADGSVDIHKYGAKPEWW